MEKSFFALGLNDNRYWGLVFVPLLLTVNRKESFYSPDPTYLSSNNDVRYPALSYTEKEIVKIIEEYSDQNLFKHFSKQKNLKEFLKVVPQENIDNFIRPFIEKRLTRILEILRKTNIKVFLREKSRANVFDEDFLEIRQNNANAIFFFERGEESSKYSLKLKQNDKDIIIKDQYSEIICNLPATIRVNNHIHFISEIEAKKIKPFFLIDEITIPKKTEKKYFKIFLKNLVLNHDVNAKGFTISSIKPEKKTLLCLEKGIWNNAVLLLRFQYGERKIEANAEQMTFVDFFEEKDSYKYEKFSRDVIYESGFHDFLNNLGLISFDQVNYELQNKRELSYKEQLYFLMEWININSNELFESGLILVQNEMEEFYSGTVNIGISSSLKVDWFDIKALISLDGINISFIQLRKHILDGNREFILHDGRIFIIPEEWFTRFKDLFSFGKIDKENLILHKQHFSILEKAEKSTFGQDANQLELLNNIESLSPEVLPLKLAANLRPYQLEGYTWLRFLQQNKLGGCLADDMGLGKTLQAISLLLKNKEDQPVKKTNKKSKSNQKELFTENETVLNSLIIVPASLVHNWKNELKRFAPSLKSLGYIGADRSKYLEKLDGYDVIISSYHTIRQDIETISAFHFHYIILDESQVIKNPSSKVYKAMQILNSDYRLVLTGTPIENSLRDLWSQMNFINKGLLGSLNYFKKEYVVPIEKKHDELSGEKLKKLINPFILRRTKKEVAKDLPEMSKQIIYCNMSENQRRFYEEEKSGIRNAIFDRIEQEGLSKSSIIVLQGLTRLRQISNHPKLIDKNYQESSGKFEEIIRNVENVISGGHKVLIFSSFVKHLNLIKTKLEASEIQFTMLTGQSSRREEIIKSFQEDEACKVFLISLKAGGVGLNLTAADYVFILDPWWNPASEEQAINRAHRIGQDKNVFVYRFISVNSIEEKIQELQEKKTKLAEGFVNANNPMSSIGEEELKGLFE